MNTVPRYSIQDLAIRAGISRYNVRRHRELRQRLARLGWREVRERVPGNKKQRRVYWMPISTAYDIVPQLGE